MKKKHYCPHCGQPIMKHTHCFNKSLGSIICQVAKKFPVNKPFHLQKDMMLTKNQYNNFQKLRYWELVEKYYRNGIRQGGYWYLTNKAIDLFKGAKVPRQIITFNNKVMGCSDDNVGLSDAVGYYDIPEVWAARAEPVERIL